MKRRQFLRTLGGTSAAVAAMAMDNPLKPAFNIASADHTPLAGGKTVVCVYLRGGIDGINIVVPHGYDADMGYYASDFRPTIAIPKPDGVPGSGAALDLAGGPLADPHAAGLGLHPDMTAMHDMFMNGNLAVMPAVHYPNASRSHFSGQYYTESAELSLDTDGWLQRYLADSAGVAPAGAMRAAGISSDLPQSLNGSSEIVSVFNDLRFFELDLGTADESAVLAGLNAVYNQTADPDRLYASIFHDFGRVTINDLEVVKSLNLPHTPDLDPDTYCTTLPEGCNYTTSTFARQMKQTALLIKAGVGLEVACLSRGGFDTHSNQGMLQGTQGRNIKDVSDNLAAFYQDLDDDGFMNDVIVVLMSEFGRTSYENGSFGTDHAHATCYFVAGTTSTINGGVYLGHQNLSGVTGSVPDINNPITDWIAYDPLNDANMLNNGRYLNHTIDYQNVFGEILSGFLGANYGGGSPNMGTLLPNYSFSDLAKVGFLV